MTFDPPSLPPAGWYPDPEGRSQQRYWNGREWEATWQTSPDDGYPDIGGWLTEAFSSMWRHVRAEAFVTLLTIVPATILLSFAARIGLADLRVENEELVGWDNDRIPALLVLGGLSILLYGVGSLAASWLGLRIADRNDGTAPAAVPADVETTSELRFAAQAFGAAVRAIPRAIGWVLLPLLAFAAVFPVVFVSPGLFVALVLLSIPVLIWLAIRFALMPVALVDRRGNPYARSWHATSGKFWSTFGRVLLLGLITGAISVAISVATSPFGATSTSLGQDAVIEIDEDGDLQRVDVESLRPDAIGIVAGAIGAIASGIAVTGTSAIALGRLYRSGGIPADPTSAGP